MIGLFIGDGYSNYSKKDRHYVIEFYLNSKRDNDIKKYLTSLLNKMKVNFFIIKDKRFNSNKIKINSKELFNFIEKERKDYNQKFKSNEYFMGFLSGFIDAEGYVSNGEILISQKDKSVLDFINKYCKINDIKITKFWCSKSYNKMFKIWKMRICTDFKYLNHNSCKIERMYSGNNPVISS